MTHVTKQDLLLLVMSPVRILWSVFNWF